MITIAAMVPSNEGLHGAMTLFQPFRPAGMGQPINRCARQDGKSQTTRLKTSRHSTPVEMMTDAFQEAT